MKFIFILLVSFLSSQAFAYTADYVPVFKSAKKSNSVAELNKNAKEDISKLRTIMNPKNKDMNLVEADENSESKRVPADI